MTRNKIIEGLDEALAWINGDGTTMVHVVENGKRISEEMTFDEYCRRFPDLGKAMREDAGQ